jgi:arsenate reductase
VNPLAIEVLREMGIDWRGHRPRGIDDLVHENWDIILTVCDKARESCPVFPDQPALAH